MPEASITLLDACAVVSLYATRQMVEILRVVEGKVAVADLVATEAQFVFRGGNGEDARERDPIDLGPLIDDGIISIISTDVEDELLTFIDLTKAFSRQGRGGQGEAMTAALAIHRQCIVVTDDRKATRILKEHGVLLRTTLDLIRAWADRGGIGADVLGAALLDLRERGTYEPPRSHPLREWWEGAL
jgi:predicted nucleic acid-binding protein